MWVRIVPAVAWMAVVCLSSPATATGQGVCDRTPQVRDKLVEVTGVANCRNVTAAHLASVTHLGLGQSGITELRGHDFSGLNRLEEIGLWGNSLTTLPEEIFTGLGNLKRLSLDNNQLCILPEGVFAGLSRLRELNFNNNRLITLPVGIFDGLDSLDELDLRDNPLSTLPEGIFDDVMDTLGTHNSFGGLLVFPHLKASVAFASTVQYVLEGTFVNVAVILSRPLPVAVRLPYSVGGSATADDYSDLSPDPGNGLLFLAGERAKYISFQLSANSRNVGKTIVLTLGELQQIGFRRSDGTGADAPHMKAEALIERPPTAAVHSVRVFERDAISDSGGVCGRTAQVRDKLMAEAGVSNCMDVTPDQLSVIPDLRLPNSGIVELRENDFKGLTSLVALYLNDNSLSTLPKGVFSDLNELRRLDLRQNSLSSLPEGVFTGLSSLEDLRLGENSLVSLPEGLFTELSSLKWLWLYHNALVALPEGLFRELSSLERLSLHNNFLSSIPQRIFNGLGNLQRLYLSHNSLGSLPQGVLEGLIPLERLWIGSNSLNRLPEGVFSGLSNLRSLLLSHNQLTVLSEDVFSGLSSLDELWLFVNQLTVLSEQHFGDLSNLRDLRLNHNSLKELPAGIFSGLNKLEWLTLADNSLSDPPEGIFEGLSALIHLILWGNDLSQLPEELFSGLHSLQELDLSFNPLGTLPDGIFRGLYSIRLLILVENRLTELPAGIFDDMLGSLGLEVEGYFLFHKIPGLIVDPHLKATLSFASTAQRAAGGTTVRVPATLSRPLPVAMRVPFTVGFSGTKGEVTDLAPAPGRGLLFLAGETRGEISFTVPNDADTHRKHRVLLSLGKPAEIGLRPSDGRGPDAPHLKTENLLLRPQAGATHTVTVFDSEPADREPYCLSLWDGAPCSTAASLPQVFTGPLGESVATTEVVITHKDPSVPECEVAVLFHLGTSPATAVAFNGQFPDRNLSRTTVPRGGARVLTLASPEAREPTTGAVYVFTRFPCTADSFHVQGRALLENRTDGSIDELFSIAAQSPPDWLGHGDCRVLTGLFGNGRNVGLTSVTAEPGMAAPAGTQLLFKAFDLTGGFIGRLPSLEVSGASQALTPWEFDQPTTLQMCLDVPGSGDFQLAVTAIGARAAGAKVQYSTERLLADPEPEDTESDP